MRKLFFAIAFALAITASAQQSYKREGNTFTAVQTTGQAQKGTQTKYTWKDREGKTYPIFLSKNGRAYVIRTSKKTGNEYKQYLGEDISRQICKETGVKYVEKK